MQDFPYDDLPDCCCAGEEENARLRSLNRELFDALECILANYKENERKGLGLGPIMKAQRAIAKAKGNT